MNNAARILDRGGPCAFRSRQPREEPTWRKVWLVALGPKASSAGDDDRRAKVRLNSSRSTARPAASPTPPRRRRRSPSHRRDSGPRQIQAAGFRRWNPLARCGATMQIVGERLGIVDQFQGVDQLTVNADGSLEILEASKAASIRFKV